MAENEEKKKEEVQDDGKYVTMQSKSFNFNVTQSPTVISGPTLPTNNSSRPLPSYSNLNLSQNNIPVQNTKTVTAESLINEYSNKNSTKVNETVGNFEIKVKKTDQNVSRSPAPQGKSESLIKVTNLDELEQKKIAELTGEEKEKAIDDIRTYNVLGKGKVCVEEKAIGRKQDGGEDGLIYQIDTVVNHPENIKFEGYILYEQPIDLTKYKKSVDTLYDGVDTPVRDIKVKTQAYVENISTNNDDSRFNEEEKAGRNEFNQVLDNVEIAGSLTKQLNDTLPEDLKIFEKFNENLQYLKRGTKLKILIDEMGSINNEGKILSYDYYTDSGSGYPTIKSGETRLTDVKVKKVQVKDLKNYNGRYTSDLTTNYYIGVTTTIYLNIKSDDIMKSSDVTWDRRDEFLGQIEILERRFEEALRLEKITYKGKDIVDMDDKNGVWYRDK